MINKLNTLGAMVKPILCWYILNYEKKTCNKKYTIDKSINVDK